MDGYARLGQGVPRLILLEAGFADLHAGRFRFLQKPVGGINAGPELLEGVMHVFGGRETSIAGNVALRAKRSGARADIFVGWMNNGVVAVAGDTAGKPGAMKRLFVRALFVELRLEHVAIRADVLHGIDAGRRSPVVAVAGGAGGRAEIAANDQRFVVNAGLILGKLIGGNPIRFHVVRIGVAARAGLGDVQRIHGGLNIADGAEVVDAVAIDADGDFGVALRQKLAVHAGDVLAELIGAQRWVVFAHERGVGMAASAERGNLAARDLSAEARGLAHGVHVGFRGIAAVATGAGQAFLSVNIVRKLF